MYQLGGSGELAATVAWYLIHHQRGMTDSIVPELTPNLFLGDVLTTKPSEQ